MAYTQANRLISIDTPLGEDILLLQGFSGHEGISRLFNFKLDLLSEEASIPFDGIVGQPVTMTIVLAEGDERYINGFVSRFAQINSDPRFTYYEAEMVSWPWFLTRTADCRIFQNMTVPDIITKIFTDLGFSDFKNMLQGSFEPREYCVQYRETDFNFVSRLMEQYGIFYFFEHEKNKHTLVMADSPTAHQPCPGQPKARCDYTAGGLEEEDIITRWQIEQELRPGKYALTDYNFKTPSTSLAVNVDSTVSVGDNDRYEIYDYPGEYLKKAQGEELVNIRMEEEEASHLVANGAGTCRAFTPGCRFDLEGHYHQDMNRSYVLTDVRHFASAGNNYITGGAVDFGGGEESYSNHFTSIPYDVPYRPSQFTPKPVIQGLQTAVVAGKKAEEVWVDNYGRVKVQFHWDREGKLDENSSCWIRVAQNWAGKRWGAMFIPRIGQEVVVAFLEGDPDQPLIVGSVYNDEQMPAYLGDGPDDKHGHDPHLSAIKTNTTKDGRGFNELRFDDTKDKEQIFIHAERNMDVRVKSSSMERVIGHRHLDVGTEKDDGKGDQRERVYGNKHLNVKHDHVEKVEGNMLLTVGKGEVRPPDGGYQDIVIEMTKRELIEADSHLHIKGQRNEKVDQDQSLDVGEDRHEKVGRDHALDAGQEIHLKAGMKVIIEAGLQLTIKGAGGFIDIGPAGVTIEGVMVKINSGGAAGAGSGSSPTAPEDAQEAEPTEPTKADNAVSGSKSAPN